MSTRRLVRPLPEIPDLPLAVLLLAEAVVFDPRSSSDHLLIMADALDEMGEHPQIAIPVVIAARILADDLRSRAPAYA